MADQLSRLRVDHNHGPIVMVVVAIVLLLLLLLLVLMIIVVMVVICLDHQRFAQILLLDNVTDRVHCSIWLWGAARVCALVALREAQRVARSLAHIFCTVIHFQFTFSLDFLRIFTFWRHHVRLLGLLWVCSTARTLALHLFTHKTNGKQQKCDKFCFLCPCFIARRLALGTGYTFIGVCLWIAVIFTLFLDFWLSVITQKRKLSTLWCCTISCYEFSVTQGFGGAKHALKWAWNWNFISKIVSKSILGTELLQNRFQLNFRYKIQF